MFLNLGAIIFINVYYFLWFHGINFTQKSRKCLMKKYPVPRLDFQRFLAVFLFLVLHILRFINALSWSRTLFKAQYFLVLLNLKLAMNVIKIMMDFINCYSSCKWQDLDHFSWCLVENKQQWYFSKTSVSMILLLKFWKMSGNNWWLFNFSTFMWNIYKIIGVIIHRIF